MKFSNLKYLSLSGNDNGGAVNDDLERVITLKQSKWFATIFNLCAVRNVKRVGLRSAFRHIPSELIRKIAQALPRE